MMMTNILLDSIGVLLLLLLLLFNRHTAKQIAFDNRMHQHMLRMTLGLCAADLCACLLQGNMDPLVDVIQIVLASYMHLVQIVVAYIWVLFVDYRLYQSERRVKGMYGRLLAIPLAVVLLLLVINLFTPFLFEITPERVYQWKPMVMLPFGIGFAYVLYSIVLPAWHYFRYRQHRPMDVMIFLLPVVLGNIVHLMLKNVSVSWVGMAIGFVALQLGMENDITYIDPLTGVYNRHFLNLHLHNMVISLEDPENYRLLAGVLIDLDKFKQLNDTFGHLAGDKALQEVGVVLREVVPGDAKVARFGGDEFVIVAMVDKREEVQELLKRLQARLTQQNQLPNRDYLLSLSIGWTIFAKHADTIDSFFNRMDEKMYRDKEGHHDQVVICKEETALQRIKAQTHEKAAL